MDFISKDEGFHTTKVCIKKKSKIMNKESFKNRRELIMSKISITMNISLSAEKVLEIIAATRGVKTKEDLTKGKVFLSSSNNRINKRGEVVKALSNSRMASDNEGVNFSYWQKKNNAAATLNINPISDNSCDIVLNLECFVKGADGKASPEDIKIMRSIVWKMYRKMLLQLLKFVDQS